MRDLLLIWAMLMLFSLMFIDLVCSVFLVARGLTSIMVPRWTKIPGAFCYWTVTRWEQIKKEEGL